MLELKRGEGVSLEVINYKKKIIFMCIPVVYFNIKELRTSLVKCTYAFLVLVKWTDIVSLHNVKQPALVLEAQWFLWD